MRFPRIYICKLVISPTFILVCLPEYSSYISYYEIAMMCRYRYYIITSLVIKPEPNDVYMYVCAIERNELVSRSIYIYIYKGNINARKKIKNSRWNSSFTMTCIILVVHHLYNDMWVVRLFEVFLRKPKKVLPKNRNGTEKKHIITKPINP